MNGKLQDIGIGSKRKKSLYKYLLYTYMAEICCFNEKQFSELMDLINEPELRDRDIEKILEQTDRLRGLFSFIDDPTYSEVYIESRRKAKEIVKAMLN